MSTSETIPGPDELLRHASFLRTLARRLVLDESRADDLVQETLLAALREKGAIRRPRSWLAGTARNISRMIVRTEARRRRREQIPIHRDPPSTPADTAARLEMQRRIVSAVTDLREPFRRTLVDRYLDGVSTEEIAAREGIAVATVRTRVHRALEMLRARFDREHRGDRRAWTLALLPIALPPRSSAAAGGAATLAVGAAMSTKKILIVVVGLLLFIGTGLLVLPGREGGDSPPASPAADRSPLPAPGEPTEDPGPAGVVASGGVDRELDLHGVVVDADGEPVPGAEISTLRRPWLRGEVVRLEHLFDEEPGPGAVADSRGAFSVRLQPGDVVDLAVEGPDGTSRIVPACQAGERVRIVLDPRTGLDVVVKDEAGVAVPGARVWIVRPGPPTSASSCGATDHGGIFRTRRVTPGIAAIAVESTTLGSPRPLKVAVVEGEVRTVTVTLDRGREIRGQVTDDRTGSAIPAARIGEERWFGMPSTTDDSGAYLYPGWNGRLGIRLRCEAEGYAPSEGIPPPDGRLDFRLVRGDFLTGCVVGPDGAPVVGARIGFLALTSGASDADRIEHVLTTTSGADGRFRLEGLRRDLEERILAVSARGYAREIFDAPARGVPGDLTDLGELTLPPARSLAGKILDAEGKPAARVRVRLQRRFTPPTKARHDAGRENRLTDDLGRFCFRDVAAGGYALTAYGPGSATGWTKLEIPDGEDVLDFELRLSVPKPRREPPHRPQVVTLSGRVRGPDGNPLPLVTVEARQRVGGQVLGRTMTDTEGRFQVRLNRAAVVKLREPMDVVVDGTSWLPDGMPGERHPVFGIIRGVTLPSEELTIQTRFVVRDRVVSVRVLDPAGQPVSGARVRIRGEQDALGSRRTDETGLLEVDGLLYEGLEITASAGLQQLTVPGVPPEPVRVRPEGQTVEIRFLEAEVIEGVVIGIDGETASGVVVHLLREERLVGTATSGADGRFRLAALPDRDHAIRAWKLDRADQGSEQGAEIPGIRSGGGPVRIHLSRVSRPR